MVWKLEFPVAGWGNLGFKNNKDRWRYIVVKAGTYRLHGSLSRLDFITSVFHRRTIFKMLALEQLAEYWTIQRRRGGGGRPTAATLSWLRV